MYPIKLICNPFTFFVINIKKSFLNFMKKIKNKVEKNKKIFTKRRILGKNVEKYK